MVDEKPSNMAGASTLQPHFGLLQATALNVTMIVGAGVFVTIPVMLQKLPGPYAILGWLAAGLLMVMDGLIWSELGATFAGSGGTYRYLLESFGPQRWGRFMAFLFIWEFLISGPLEIASGLIAMASFSNSLSPSFRSFNELHMHTWTLMNWQGDDLNFTFSPARIGCFAFGLFLIYLLHRNISSLGRWTVTLWLGVLGVAAWILIEGLLHFDRNIAFDFRGIHADSRGPFARGLAEVMILAMYSYLGYYHVCYIGDEVRSPGRTIPWSILLSAVLVCMLFVGMHLAMLGTISWRDVPENINGYNLPAEFARRIHGDSAAVLVTLLLLWTCAGSAFAAMLGYSRVPYGAARHGHFFAIFGRVHPVHRIPNVALLLIGGLTLFWSFFDLEKVIFALVTTRIPVQFAAQIAGLVWLRHTQPSRPRPFRIWLYPLPCGLALAGWLFLYCYAGVPFVLLGLITVTIGILLFLFWSYGIGAWPFKDHSVVET